MYAWGSHFARAIQQARRQGCEWIGLDLIPTISGGAAADRDLFLALREAEGRVVLANARFSDLEPSNPLPILLYAHPEQGANLGFIDAQPEPDE
jgi:hypothetical protein